MKTQTKAKKFEISYETMYKFRYLFVLGILLLYIMVPLLQFHFSGISLTKNKDEKTLKELIKDNEERTIAYIARIDKERDQFITEMKRNVLIAKVN